jgi:prepilin-type processing-associated H-X9-DG protein
MTSLVAILMSCALGQAPGTPVADPRASALAPFVDASVLAVVQLDLAHGDLRALADRLAGERPPSMVADMTRALLAWSDALRGAGAKELDVVLSVSDLPGLPYVVVPLGAGSDAAAIGRLFCGGGPERPPIAFPTCATIHNAVMAGTPAALERVRGAQPAARPELAAAFAAVGDEKIGLRLLILPSPDTRRVLEETVPTLPREFGGGPITELTRGVLWAAAGLEAGPQPSFRLVVASPSTDAAGKLRRLGQDLVASLEKSPALQGLFPEFPGLASQFQTEIVGDRITVTADARVAAGLIDSTLRPAREAALRSRCVNNEKQIALAMHNYISAHKLEFPPAYTADKAGKPLLSWRVLILPYLEQEALFKEFHLDEPWDSPHNRALVAKMPQVFRCPLGSAEVAGEGKTRYLTPRGPNTVFRGAEPVKINEITDGTSNTIIVVDVGDERAVTWTKPEDWEIGPDPKAASGGIFSAHGGRTARGTNAAYADGSVHFLRETIKPATLRNLLTSNGGEVIASDDD